MVQSIQNAGEKENGRRDENSGTSESMPHRRLERAWSDNGRSGTRPGDVFIWLPLGLHLSLISVVESTAVESRS